MLEDKKSVDLKDTSDPSSRVESSKNFEKGSPSIPFFRLMFDHGYIPANIRDYRYPGSGTEADPFLVEWTPIDPRNPMNTSPWKRWLWTFLESLATFAVTLTTSGYSAGPHEIYARFGPSQEVYHLGFSVFVLGFALGPLIWGPLSECYGRQLLFFLTDALEWNPLGSGIVDGARDIHAAVAGATGPKIDEDYREVSCLQVESQQRQVSLDDPEGRSNSALYLFFAAFPIVFSQHRGWDETHTGLAFLGIGAGVILGIIYTFFDHAKYAKLQETSSSELGPEARLPQSLVGCIAIPIGLFWFAWTITPTIHFMAPLYMYDGLGINWASTVPAILATLCVPFPFLFWKRGEKIRRRCKYAAEAEESIEWRHLDLEEMSIRLPLGPKTIEPADQFLDDALRTQDRLVGLRYDLEHIGRSAVNQYFVTNKTLTTTPNFPPMNTWLGYNANAVCWKTHQEQDVQRQLKSNIEVLLEDYGSGRAAASERRTELGALIGLTVRIVKSSKDDLARHRQEKADLMKGH
ncbi:MAG: hypothetical protein Q9223_001027 [Gallowayella weberi]